MNLLLDQDVYSSTARFLRANGHDVMLASEIGLSRASDEELLKEAQQRNRLFVTRDRDFGNLVFVRSLGSGVIYLRVVPQTLVEVHAELDKVLRGYSEDELAHAFVVVERNRHRIRWLPDDA